MELDQLPFDALRSLHTALAVPSGPAAPREQLRAADVGFHVTTSGADHDVRQPLAMDPPPERIAGPVIKLRFGASPRG